MKCKSPVTNNLLAKKFSRADYEWQHCKHGMSEFLDKIQFPEEFETKILVETFNFVQVKEYDAD